MEMLVALSGTGLAAGPGIQCSGGSDRYKAIMTAMTARVVPEMAP